MTTNLARKRAPELTRRDHQVMAWIGEQYGVRLDVAAVLLGRLSPGGTGAPLSRRSVRVQVDRWQRSRLAVARSMLGSVWIIPTEAGLRYGGLSYAPWPARGSRLEHAHAVAMVRLAVEQFGGAWTGERALRRERHLARQAHPDSAPWHAPDGIAEGPPGRLLIEVELSLHHDSEVLDALSRPWRNTAGVVYYTRPEMVIRVTDQLARLWPQLELRHRTREHRVLPLPEVPGATYEGGW